MTIIFCEGVECKACGTELVSIDVYAEFTDGEIAECPNCGIKNRINVNVVVIE